MGNCRYKLPSDWQSAQRRTDLDNVKISYNGVDTDRLMFPKLHAWIEESRQFYQAHHASVALLKAYCLVLSGASPYDTCACSSFDAMVLRVATAVHLSPATVATAFLQETRNDGTLRVKFRLRSTQTEPFNLSLCRTVADAHTQLRSICEFGICWLNGQRAYYLFSELERYKSDFLRRLVSEPALQIAVAARLLDVHLDRPGEHEAAAVSRAITQFGESEFLSTAEKVVKQYRQLLAAGHTRAL